MAGRKDRIMTQKVTVKKKALHAALQKIMKVVPNGGTNIMALKYVHLSTEKDKLVLRGTDLDAALVVRVEAEGEIETCVLGKALQALSRPESRKDNSAVVIECVEDANVGIQVDSMTTKVKSFPVEDYPALPKGRLAIVAKDWDSAELKKLFKYALLAMSDDVTRPHINCAAFLGRKLVTTDGHRLHTAVLPAKVKKDVLLPSRAAYVCEKLLAKKASVSIKTNGKRVLIQSDDWELYSKFGEGQFPPYDQVIPRGNDVYVEIETDVLAKVLKKLSSLASSLKLSLQDGKCKILTTDETYGYTETELPVKQVEGPTDEIVVGLNMSYLAEVIQFDFDKAIFKFGRSLDPIVVEAGGCRQSVIMPMRI